MTKKPTRAPKASTKPRKKPAPRADFGKPVDSFFDKQPEPHRSIMRALRTYVEAAAPEAESSIKWGMAHYTIAGKMFCAINSHKAHVNLVLTGPPGAYKDPKGLLSGESKLGRHLKLRSLEEMPHGDIKTWLKTCATLVRAK